jgi:hypothetical protein
MGQGEWGRGLTVIEPIPKAVKTMFDEILRCSKIEPWVDWPRALATQVIFNS